MKLGPSLALTAALLLNGCSKEEPSAPAPSDGNYPGTGNADGGGGTGGMGNEEAGALPGGGVTPASNAGEIEKLDAENAAPVLAERDGQFYQVYEIAKEPYTGKVVLYFPSNTESSEKVFENGKLVRHTEWHENGQKKMEAVADVHTGKLTAKHFDEEGKPVKAPVKIVTAPGRGLEWTLGFGPANRNIKGYEQQQTSLVKRVLGDPDEIQNGVWIYNGMKVKTQGGALMTTVRLSVQGDVVLSVSVEP